jgi:hypothetical protein
LAPFISNIWIRLNTTFDDSREIDGVTLYATGEANQPPEDIGQAIESQ